MPRLGELLVDFGLRGMLVRAGLLRPACGERIDWQDAPEPLPWPPYPRERVMVALLAGQSNAANGGQDPSPPAEGVYNFFQGRCYRARDPLLGASGRGGSPWVRLARRVVESGLYDAVLLVPVAVGGTRIAHWEPRGELHPRLTDTIDAVHASGFRFTHVFWHQGESDAAYGTSRSRYGKALRSIIAAMRRRGVEAPIMICRAATMRGAVSPQVRAAQEEIIATLPGMVAGPDTDELLGPQYRYDRLHFSGPGLDAFAERLFAAMRQ